MRLWKVATRERLGEAIVHDGAVVGARFSPDGQQVLSWSVDGTLRLWDSSTGRPVGEPMESEFSWEAADFAPDGQTIFSMNSAIIQLWDRRTQAPIGDWMGHDGGAVRGAAPSRDGSRIVSWGNPDVVKIWNAATRTLVADPIEFRASGAIFSPDATMIGAYGGVSARLFDAATGRAVGRELAHERPIGGIGFSPTSDRVVSWSDDGMLRLWSARSGRPHGEPLRHAPRDSDRLVFQDGIGGARFTEDGARLLSWGSDRTVRLWDVASTAQIGQSMSHEGGVRGAVFTADEHRILSWSYSNLIHLWDTETRRDLGLPMAHNERVGGVAFSPDEQTILSWGEDGAVRLWEVGVDLDVPAELLALEVQVFTGTEMNLDTREITLLDPGRRERIKADYWRRGRAHFQECRFPDHNRWSRLFPEEAAKVRRP